jgi:[ribosomal protein S5]-alanine N-acetyltransferase
MLEENNRVVITLDPIPVDDLVAISNASIPGHLEGLTLQDALPPAHIAKRCLNLIQGGHAVPWCNTFYIRESGRTIVGGCRFKGKPSDGCVEIGYWISPERRKQGVATQAIDALLALAFQSNEVSEVLAKVGERNVPSTALVQKLGFVIARTELDEDGNLLVHWVLRAPSKESLPETL